MTQVTADVRRIPELFTMGRFEVPWHQRYYDWEEEQVGELLADLRDALDEKRESYFLGSIMLVGDGSPWEVNDGQQRLITLSLLVAAFCRHFARQRESEFLREQLALRVLFDCKENEKVNFDDTSREVLRLIPPLHDRIRFAHLIRGHDVGTNGKLTAAWNLIAPFVGTMASPAQCAFFDFLIERVEISVLYVPRIADTNAVFEALNGRGKTLEDLDLIRNHLYSYFADSDDKKRRTIIHQNLETTLSALSMTRNSKQAREYFRCFFQCEYGFLQEQRFYRTTRTSIRTAAGQAGGAYVYRVVDDLANPASVELFRSISASTPNRDLIEAFCRASETSNDLRNLAVFLAELRSFKVVKPLLFSLLRLFAKGSVRGERQALAKAVHKCISDLTSFVMREALCQGKFEPSKFEAAFANCAQEIAQVRVVEDLDIMDRLRECDRSQVTEDERFVSKLASVQMKDTRGRAKRLLFSVNSAKQSDGSTLDYVGCTVEPVLPAMGEHWEGWSGFQDVGRDLRDWVNRIGNFVLLESGGDYHSATFNAEFGSKRPILEQSRYLITRAVAGSDDWTPDEIEQRSWKLAGEAASVWAFSGGNGQRRGDIKRLLK